MNAQFFHQIANSNKRFNSIELLFFVNGSASSDQPVIRDQLFSSMIPYFQKNTTGSLGWMTLLSTL
jgi:hypothetical protein